MKFYFPIRPMVFAIGLLLLSLTGCATRLPPPYNDSINWPTRKASLRQADQWVAEGSVRIKTPHHTDTVSVQWIQTPAGYNLDFYGPLGIGGALLQGNAKTVTLTKDTGEITIAATPEELLQKSLGWTLPVSALQKWIRGIPDDAAAIDSLTLDRYQHLRTLQQLGWTIEYLAYTGVNHQDLPSRLSLSRKNIQILINVQEWQ